MVEVGGRPDGGLTLRPHGQLCHFQLDPLRSALDAALATATGEIRVDLGEVTLLSSSAVELLESAALECGARGLEILGAGNLAAPPMSLA
jgi:anti-anti-sigma regulatory factor